MRKTPATPAPGTSAWLVLLVLFSLFMAACGGGAPTAPTSTRVSGAWIGNATLSSVGGGACVAAKLQTALGQRDIFSARVQQEGTNLAASITYQGNRTSCLYRGTLNGSSLDLHLVSCPAGLVERFVCADGSVRQLEITGGRFTAAASSGTGTGTDTTTWSVFEPGRSTPLGTVVLSAQFRWNVLGIPHDDFHIFDGSILPGYVDGVVIIPEEPNPFCTACGWF